MDYKVEKHGALWWVIDTEGYLACDTGFTTKEEALAVCRAQIEHDQRKARFIARMMEM